MDLFRRQTKAPSKEAAAKGYFRAKATMDLETVTAKLAAVEAEIATAEGELSRVSLASVLSDDQATGFEAVTRLNELRTRREILRHRRPYWASRAHTCRRPSCQAGSRCPRSHRDRL